MGHLVAGNLPAAMAAEEHGGARCGRGRGREGEGKGDGMVRILTMKRLPWSADAGDAGRRRIGARTAASRRGEELDGDGDYGVLGSIPATRRFCWVRQRRWRRRLAPGLLQTPAM